MTALAGGTGAAKLLRGLAACLPARDLTVIGNTGDDAAIWGLHVSPDLDTVTYALAGWLDTARGWGLRDETFHALDAMARYGEPTWFQLGDRDLATHLLRTGRLQRGETLTAVTADIAARLGVETRVLPMSDDPVRTRIRTPDGWLGFQEYFVRDKAQVTVEQVRYDGAAQARPAPGVLDSLADADLVVVCPSNPVTSIGPILAVPGVAAALTATGARIVGVSPIIGAAAVSGPAAALMRACGLPVSAAGVAHAYAPWLDVLLVDETDRGAAGDVAAAGARAVVAPILMTDRPRELALARCVLASVR